MAQKLGIHLVENHFYEPIPDTRKLNESLWRNNSEMIGLNINEKKQLELLSFFSARYKQEYSQFPKQQTPSKNHRFFLENGSYESVDAEILYSMVRFFQPRKILEVGSGFSTLISGQAIRKTKEENKNYDCELTVIDPYPTSVIERGFPELTKVIKQPVEEVSYSLFETLGPNDILFIDSSHVLKIGSDVQFEYLEIIPRVNAGVLIHIHDIFLPAQYPKKWVIKKHVFWNEQYLLQAFMSFNNCFEVVWSGNYFNQNFPEKLSEAFASYQPGITFPGSFWIKRIS